MVEVSNLTKLKMDDLEGLVRRIVNTVNQTRNRPEEHNANSTRGAPTQQSNTTVEEEVRRHFTLPRNACASTQQFGKIEIATLDSGVALHPMLNHARKRQIHLL